MEDFNSRINYPRARYSKGQLKFDVIRGRLAFGLVIQKPVLRAFMSVRASYWRPVLSHSPGTFTLLPTAVRRLVTEAESEGPGGIRFHSRPGANAMSLPSVLGFTEHWSVFQHVYKDISGEIGQVPCDGLCVDVSLKMNPELGRLIVEYGSVAGLPKLSLAA